MKLLDSVEGEFDGLTGGKVPLKVKDSVSVGKIKGPGSAAGKFYIALDADGHWYLHTDGKPHWGSGDTGHFDSSEQANEVLAKWQAGRK